MTYSYNDNISPHKIKGDYISVVEQALLKTEENKDIANLFTSICSAGWEFRYVKLAQKIKEGSALPKLQKEASLQTLRTMCTRYHLLSDLQRAIELLKSERAYSRLINRL